MIRPKRKTDYANEIASSGEGNHRIERLYVKEQDQVEIRFSWWNNDKMALRPLDLPEHELLQMMKEAIHEGVFTEGFLKDLTGLLYETRRTAKYADPNDRGHD